MSGGDPAGDGTDAERGVHEADGAPALGDHRLPGGGEVAGGVGPDPLVETKHGLGGLAGRGEEQAVQHTACG